MTPEQLSDHLKGGGQIIKTRDDRGPVFLAPSTNAADANDFTLVLESMCSWAGAAERLGTKHLRPRVEPWLTSLVQSEHLGLLVGSGLTHAVHGLATGASMPAMAPVAFEVLGDEIELESKRIAKAAGREAGNLEDRIRVATELLRGIEIIAATKPADSPQAQRVAKLREEIDSVLKSFAQSILSGEQAIATAVARADAFEYLVNFLLSFASRTGTRERLQIFTTNYDRVLEAGADAAGLRLIDRFVGTLAPVFRASRLDVDLHYNPPGIRGEPRYLEGVARITKLHGSVDWLDHGGTIKRIGLPFGATDVSPYLNAPGLAGARTSSLMIFPNSGKDRETSAYPYVELFRDLAAAMCRPNSTLVCFGYSFGDDHINRVIEDMLTIPSTHLVIIAYGDPLGRIMQTYQRLGRSSQISLLLGNHVGELKSLVDSYLPKPSIDRTTFRMAELLKARWGTDPQRQADMPPAVASEGDE